MALLSIVFGRLPGLSQKVIGVLPVDVFTQETISLTSEVTDHPVETGSTISDHIKNDPMKLMVTGNVRASRRSLAFHLLTTLYERRHPVFIVTGLQTFTNMAITRLEIPREVQTGQNLPFSAEFKKIVFATSQTGQAPAAGNGAADTAASTASLGGATPVAATPSQTAAASETIADTGGPSGSFLSRAFSNG